MKDHVYNGYKIRRILSKDNADKGGFFFVIFNKILSIISAGYIDTIQNRVVQLHRIL